MFPVTALAEDFEIRTGVVAPVLVDVMHLYRSRGLATATNPRTPFYLEDESYPRTLTGIGPARAAGRAVRRPKMAAVRPDGLGCNSVETKTGGDRCGRHTEAGAEFSHAKALSEIKATQFRGIRQRFLLRERDLPIDLAGPGCAVLPSLRPGHEAILSNERLDIN